jgi:CheY-like chemotaxis protein
MSARLLVVDDSEMIRTMVARIVGKEFDAVDQASDGRAALQLLRGRQAEGGPLPTVIISDFDMAPGMDGDAFARELAKDDGLRSIPFVLSSGDPNASRVARELGVPFFQKTQQSMAELRALVLQLRDEGRP